MNYIENAHRTSAPVEPVMDRLAATPQSLQTLYIILRIIALHCAVLDKWKAWAFYGKGGCPMVPALLDLPRTAPVMAMENALGVISDLHFIEILHAVIGDASESGEMIDALIPALYENKALDIVNIHEEAGDKLWYLAKLFKFTNTDFGEVMYKNIAKLQKRYPQKFTEQAAIERDLDEERKELEAHFGSPNA